MATQRKAPEGELDVEGHAHRRRTDVKATSEAGAGPETGHKHRAVDDDVEGHSMIPSPAMTRNAQQSREREIQRSLREHELKAEARRPFHKGSR